ncbi:Detected protein of confused Function [Hibiscus syriacus]|uniref:Detected protein of confused Function n=1 Tax=Hibiscus syriacus TaxID=106335 RepID=A0A6A3CE98_HIBSY|nr:Detected protein of confused Function [Hibiscus syriacus]
MSHKALDPHYSIDTCTFHLHSWRSFHLQQIVDSSYPQYTPSKLSSTNGFHPKRHCFSDRTISFCIDLSKLTLLDEDNNNNNPNSANPKRSSFRLFARKKNRHHRGLRSVSGRSSNRSRTRMCNSVGTSTAYGMCLDFLMAMGTDSSEELFGNGISLCLIIINRRRRRRLLRRPSQE